jgi:hypothetical protein
MKKKEIIVLLAVFVLTVPFVFAGGGREALAAKIEQARSSRA